MGLRILRSPRDYSKYSLEKNPFPYAGIPEENPRFCADREKELETISDTISLSLGENSTHIALIGGYGNGKTHTLRYIKSQVNSQLAEDDNFRAIAGYVISPGHSLVDTYRNFMQDLGRNFFIRLTWEFLGSIALEVIQQGKNDFKDLPSEVKDGLEKNPSKLKSYVENGTILLSLVMETAREEVLSLIRNVDVANGFLQLISDKNSLLAWKWLSGERMLHEQRRELGIVSPIDSDDRALVVFQDMRSIMRKQGYKLVCILIDEFELVETLHHQQKQRFLNAIRHLIDLNPNGLCLMISCTPEVWKNIVMEYHAFSERIFREIVLRPLNEKTICHLIHEYLKHYRTNPKLKSTSVYPFTEECIKEILQISKGNMRQALAMCNIALDVAIKQGNESITPQILKRLYETPL